MLIIPKSEYQSPDDVLKLTYLYHFNSLLLLQCIIREFFAGYFTLRSLLEGSGLAGAKEKLITRFFTTLFGAWKFWPMANAVNFWFVPFQFRVLYMNILSLFWTGWLTYVNSRKISVPKKD
jgi:protein Mpv17